MRIGIFVYLMTISTVFSQGTHSSHQFIFIPNQKLKLQKSKQVFSRSLQKLNRTSMPSLRELQGKEFIQKEKQFFNGVEVFGSKIINHYFQGVKLASFTRQAQIRDLSVVPLLSSTKAQSLAQLKFQMQKSKSKLVIYPFEDENVLTWEVEELAFDRRLKVFINAQTGEVIDAFNALTSNLSAGMRGKGQSGQTVSFRGVFEDGEYQLIDKYLNLETYNYSRFSGLPGNMVISDSSYVENIQATDAHYFSSEVLKVLQDKFNRNGYDGNGGRVRSTVNYTRNGGAYINAFWNGSQLVYGVGGESNGDKSHPLSASLDIIAHEITHAITENTSDLIYRGESGALNESFSDILGTYFEYRIQRNEFDWMLGEDAWLSDEALRYMNNPTRDGVSKDHYDDRYTGWSDNGGVHFNSGIVNLAFYLLVQGGVHPRKSSISVQGIGIEKAVEVFYKAFTEFLSSNSDFSDAREATVYVAGFHGSHIVNSVKDAWAAVGVGEPGDGSSGDNDEDGNDDNNPLEVVIDANLDIPDRDYTGVSSYGSFEADVSKLEVEVSISHTYIGDLQVTLISPNQKAYLLHRRLGGSKDNLYKTYSIELKSGDSSRGVWKLQVSDHANRDTGILESWSLRGLN